MIKVLHIFSGYGGGISSLVLNLIENKNDGFQFDLMAFSYEKGENFVARIESMGGSCIQMPRPRKEGYKVFIKFLKDVFKKEKYDAVHCHITGYNAVPFYIAAKQNGVKSFIMHAHTTRYDSAINRMFPINIINKYINYYISDIYMTCSDIAAEYIYGKRHLAKRPAILIPNGINENRYLEIKIDRQAYLREFDLSEDNKIILHVGRFSYPKNHSFMLEIMQEMLKKDIRYKMIFVGDGDLLSSVKEAAEARGLAKDVRFIGRRQDIAQLMRFADLMILPSFNEGLPTVAVESQAAGTPILLADTITRQADMGLGLVKYLSIDHSEPWVNEICEWSDKPHLDLELCVSKIRRNGFTSRTAGMLYCEVIGKELR